MEKYIRSDKCPSLATAIEERVNCSHTLRVLKKNGIDTMEQLSEMTDEQLLALRGVGRVIAGGLRNTVTEWRSETGK